ncbi:MAG: homoserine kinase [Nitrososphaera sp.]|nr:homoserine kinase [Nitrososphaera sp.]
MKSRTAIAPCSTANLGPGYDVFGLALDALEDRVKITTMRSSTDSNKILIRMLNNQLHIPSEVDLNSAGLVASKMAKDFGIQDRLEVEVKKGVPAGYGVGSSGASAAATAVAFNALFDLKLDKTKLVEYAAEGEIASAGAAHYDNVSASLLGGFVIASATGAGKRFIRIEPPKDLVLVVAIPLSMKVPKKKTEVARSVLPRDVSLHDVVHNVSSASTIVAGFAMKDVEMIASGIDDVIIEPARKHLIPGYEQVKKNALGSGALAVTISGAGPSMIAFLKTKGTSKNVARAMEDGYRDAGLESKTYVCRPSSGARVL